MKRRFIEVELYRYHVFIFVSDRPGHECLAALGPGMNSEHVLFGISPEGSWRVNLSVASLNALAQAESERTHGT